MSTSLKKLNKIIRDRRSTYPRNFKNGVQIKNKVIEDLLENAIWAPTHKLTQPWQFKVFYGEGVKLFFDKQLEIYKEITPGESQKNQKIQKYKDKAEQVSHIIVVIAKHDSAERIPQIEEIVATSCALQNIYLSLEAHGIAGYLSTGNICYTKQMSDFLELNKADKVLGFFQLGIPSENINRPLRKRIPASEKTEWIDG